MISLSLLDILMTKDHMKKALKEVKT